MSDLVENHIVGFPTRRLKEKDFVMQSVLLYPVLWNAKVTCVVFT